ncbi:Hsp33 family molecular chaperone HslO [Peptococcaceae bacterium 1198_IL3148]
MLQKEVIIVHDYLVRAIGAEGQFKIFACTATDLVEEARERHNTWPIATAALGRTMISALLLGANMKGEDIITIRIIGDGPLGAVIVTADAKGNVRGYVQNPHVHLPSPKPGKLAVGAAVGNGLLTVSRDLGLREPFSGSVELVTGEIGEDLALYLTKSEQTPSAVSLGVLVETDNSVLAAGGLILQLMPGADEGLLDQLEQNLSVLPPISGLVNQGKTPEDIIAMVCAGVPFKILEKNPIQFCCNCSRDRLERILISIGRDELQKMLDEDAMAEVQCHFCSDKYNFNEKDLKRLLNELT